MKRASNQRITSVFARLRRDDVLKALDESNFKAWRVKVWNKRFFLRRSLSFMFSFDKLVTMSFNEWLGWFYHISVQSQHQDRQQNKANLRPWAKAFAKASKPDEVQHHNGDLLVAGFLKSKFSHNRGIWSLPRAFFEGTDGEEAAGHQLPADPPQAAMVVGDAFAEGPAEGPIAEDLCFFEVVDAVPERLKVVHASHLELNTRQIDVKVYEQAALHHHEGRVVRNQDVVVDKKVGLRPFLQKRVLQNLKMWSEQERQAVAVKLPARLHAALRLHAFLRRPAAIEEVGSCGPAPSPSLAFLAVVVRVVVPCVALLCVLRVSCFVCCVLCVIALLVFCVFRVLCVVLCCVVLCCAMLCCV